nr:hypothetical protein [Tanacetum cinerariifolium]
MTTFMIISTAFQKGGLNPVDTFANIAKESKTLLLPINDSNPGRVAAEAIITKECSSADDNKKKMVFGSKVESESVVSGESVS